MDLDRALLIAVAATRLGLDGDCGPARVVLVVALQRAPRQLWDGRAVEGEGGGPGLVRPMPGPAGGRGNSKLQGDGLRDVGHRTLRGEGGVGLQAFWHALEALGEPGLVAEGL